MAHTDNNHKAYINAKGKRVIRVTDVIKIMAKDQLILWANMLGFKHVSYKSELERTANIGSLVHSVLEAYHNPHMLATVDYDDYSIYDYGDKLEATHAIESFFKWYDHLLRTKSFKVMYTEHVVVGENLGGTIDCVIRGWEDPNKVILVDYKTSKEFYLTQFLQTAAYRDIYEEVHGRNTVEGVMIIIMDKKYGDSAQARFVNSKNLDLFSDCFWCMYDLARSSKMLEQSMSELTEYIDQEVNINEPKNDV